MRLAEEFPRRETSVICSQLLRSELRDAELALQFLYREEAGEIVMCPPRAGIDIRRDIRKLRIRLRGLRRRVV